MNQPLSTIKDSEKLPSFPIWTTLIFVGPAAILAVSLVAVIFGEERRPWLPAELIFSVIFYLTPVVFVYTFVLLYIHKRKYSVDFWMTELLLALFPLVPLGAYFAFGLAWKIWPVIPT
jgi:hypothetical protein